MTDKEAIAALRAHVLPPRWVRLSEAAYRRTRWVTVAFDSLTHAHNVNAVLRTCECLGVQDVHMVTGGSPLAEFVGISRGALDWLCVHEYATLSEELSALRAMGYRLVGTTPRQSGGSVAVADFDPSLAPFVLFLGQEKHGLAMEVAEAMETGVYVPMVGLTESLNVSVAAGMLLQSLMERMAREHFPYQVPEEEGDAILLTWLRRTVRSADLILDRREGAG